MMALRLRWRLSIAVLLLVAVGAAVYASFRFFAKAPGASLPAPGSPVYADYAEAFEIGVAALDVDLLDVARTKLTFAIEKIPEEPAAWANRGLLHLRDNKLKEAGADLARAQALAPESAEVENLLGRLAEKEGRFPDAAIHFRNSLGRKPDDVMTRYALASIRTREGGDEAEAEAQKQLEEILRLLPRNLFVLYELADAAVRRRDAKALAFALESFEKLAPQWSAETRDRFATVVKDNAALFRGPAPVALIRFGNYLRREKSYPQARYAVEPRGGNIGEPIVRFLKLKQTRLSPSPPDADLAFSPAPLATIPAVANARWDVVLPVWLTTAADPVVMVANGRELRKASLEAPALPFPGGSKAVAPTTYGVLPLDWNNDYRTDFILAGAGGLRFFQQDASGSFTDVTENTKLDRKTLDAVYYGAWAADVEMDGDLDVVVAPVDGPPVVLRNNRDGGFKVVPSFPGVTKARAFVWADFDNDGAPDAAFLDAEGRLHVFANQRSGEFKRRESPAALGGGIAIAAANLGDDEKFALLVLQADGKILRLSDKDKGEAWEDRELVTAPMPAGKLPPGGASLLVADLDDDGGLDLIVSSSQATHFWLNDDGGFQAAKLTLGGGVTQAVSLTQRDPLDLLALSKSGQPVRFASQGSKGYHWASVRPRAANSGGDDRINSFAIGGEIEVRLGVSVQKQLIKDPVVHFGLGERTKAAVIRVLWPNGAFQVELDQAGDKVIAAEQRLKASCPFLFTWDGAGVQFVTDFMWSTPLGMYINAQDKGGFLQTTDWVKIRGDQLKPRDGFYDVRVLANLWETHFFDHVALLVVDHPPNTEIYADERFAFTPMQPHVYATAPPRPVAHAVDQDGRDVTDVVRAVDGRYLASFPIGRFQGIAKDHWVEIDLGADAPKDVPLVLLATGWVHPTDSSINVAVEQGDHERPRGLVLEVPDGAGGWKTGQSALGFPAGKNKTMVIRLDGVDGKAAPRRFRLRTNMEIYWDALAYAHPLDPGVVRQSRLNPDGADLHFYGIVEMTAANRSSPELPHYDRIVRRDQYWRDLVGYHTRYGDVRELLAGVDDRYVIINAGDELAMRFRTPADPQVGWKRDFIWISDGWVKDGDLNTRFSKTVLPLPFHGRKSYDRPPGRLEDDPVYQRFPKDWQVYHTRYVSPDVFERGLHTLRRTTDRSNGEK